MQQEYVITHPDQAGRQNQGPFQMPVHSFAEPNSIRFDFGAILERIYWEKTCLNTNTEPCVWIYIPKYCFNSEILVAAFPFGQS